MPPLGHLLQDLTWIEAQAALLRTRQVSRNIEWCVREWSSEMTRL